MSVSRFVPSARTRALVYVGIGIILVTNPLYLDPLDLGEERYTYTAAEITPTESGIQYESELPDNVQGVRGIECYFGQPQPVECLAQGTLIDGDPHSRVLTTAYSGDFTSYIRLNNTLYNRSYRGESVANQATRITVRYTEADARTVLDSVSVSPDYIQERHRSVITSGQVHSDSPLSYETSVGQNTYEPTGLIAESDNEYFLVGLDEYDEQLPNRGAYSVSGVVIGILALWYGWRLSNAELTTGD